MKEIIVDIPYECSVYIERLNYEYITSRNLLRYLMSQETVKEEHLQRYADMAEQKCVALEMAKEIAFETYVPDKEKKYSYTIDFKNCRMIFKEKGYAKN